MNDTSTTLHDIKGIVPIPDLSLYYFIVLAIIVLLLVISIVIFLLKFKKKKTEHEIYLEKLNDIDFKDAKKDAYLFTKYTSHLTLNENTQHNLESINQHLEQYKYKKDVAPFDEQTRQKLTHFITIARIEQ